MGRVTTTQKDSVIENGMVKSKNTAREHGIGLRSVRDIVEEQDGRMEICTDGE